MILFKFPPKVICFLISIWPPFWFTGIRFGFISDTFQHIRVHMKLHFYNKNVVGIHYGGNLFSMTDPCYMIMLMKNMGKGYRVIDQSASIEFINPGLGEVTADCYLNDEDIRDIQQHTENGDKYLKTFTIYVRDQEGSEIAKVHRTVYIRKVK